MASKPTRSTTPFSWRLSSPHIEIIGSRYNQDALARCQGFMWSFRKRQTSLQSPWRQPATNIVSLLLISAPFIVSPPRIAASLDQKLPPKLQPHLPDRLFVRPLPEVLPENVRQLRERTNARLLKHYPSLDDLQLWQISPDIPLQSAIKEIEVSDIFDFVEPDYLIYTAALPKGPESR